MANAAERLMHCDFASSTRSSNDMAGVFEFEEGTGYFYLYSMEPNGNRILDHIFVFSGANIFSSSDINISWDEAEDRVGLFLRGTLWAVFNVRLKIKFGGQYYENAKPNIPQTEMFLPMK